MRRRERSPTETPSLHRFAMPVTSLALRASLELYNIELGTPQRSALEDAPLAAWAQARGTHRLGRALLRPSGPKVLRGRSGRAPLVPLRGRSGRAPLTAIASRCQAREGPFGAPSGQKRQGPSPQYLASP